jgi:hypothetical protein
MAAIYSNGGNRWNILGFNFTKRDALSSVYKISMTFTCRKILALPVSRYKCVSLSEMVDCVPQAKHMVAKGNENYQSTVIRLFIRKYVLTFYLMVNTRTENIRHYLKYLLTYIVQ